MLDEIIRIILLIAITSIYAYFDVFNKREIPNIFAYASIAIALIAAVVLGGDPYYILLLAAGIAVFGYLIYEKGFLGGGDVFEFVVITLLLPLQPIPFFINVQQLGLPFILSVFIASGYASIIIILIYYIVFAKKTEIERNFRIERIRILKAVSLIIAYLLLIGLIYYILKISILGIILLIIIAVLSALIMIFEKLINYRMVKELEPTSIKIEDMIAINLMPQSELDYFKKHSKHFGRLATREMLNEIKEIKKKLPVYRNAAPLSAFILIGVILSLFFGNIILLII